MSFPVVRRVPGVSSLILVCLALFAVTCVVYWPVRTFAFLTLGADDPVFVSENPNVQAGFTRDTLISAFRPGGEEGLWLPLTRLSHTLDYKLFGLNAGYHHLSAVFFHIVAGWCLFLFLVRATSTLWPGALVAAIFLLHPLHVESVAWISERKDVLCALFWFLALFLWVRYSERPSVGRYVLSMLALTLGILAKPMIVSFPLILVLLDYWPLRREFRWLLVTEKILPILLATGCGWLAFTAQSGAGAVQPLSALPISLRVQNTFVSLLHYLEDSLWPSDLAFSYPYPTRIPATTVLIAIAIIFLVTAAAVWWRQHCWLIAGWLWFLVTIGPVCGLVQVGNSARSDHYMYVPLVGLSTIAIWSGVAIVQRQPRTRPILVAVAVTVCILFAVATRRQLTWWHDGETLYRRAISVIPNNYLAWHLLALHLAASPDRLPEAREAARNNLRIRPDFATAHNNVAYLALAAGDLSEALAEADSAVRLFPAEPIGWFLSGSALYHSGRVAESKVRLQRAVELDPQQAPARLLLSHILVAEGHLDQAIVNLRAALRADPLNAGSHGLLGSILFSQGNRDEAIGHLDEAVRLNPGMWDAEYNLGRALINNPYRRMDALSHLEAAVRLQPNNAAIHRALGSLLAVLPGRMDQALVHFEVAQRLAPSAEVQKQLDALRSRHPLSR